MSLAVIVVGIALAIGFHEAAHLLVARWCGIAVTDAYWGFGPKLWSRQIGKTTYGVRWIPLGGYVKLASGPNSHWSDGTPVPTSEKLETANQWKRASTILAGVAANVLFAFILFWGMSLTHGKWTPVTQVDRVVQGSAADLAGLRVGDRLVSVGDVPIVQWDDLGTAVAPRPGQQVDIVIERDSRTVRFDNITLGHLGEIGFLGVGPLVINETVGTVESLGFAAESTASGLVNSTKLILQLFNPSYFYGLLADFGEPDSDVRDSRPVSVVGVIQVGSARQADEAILLVAVLNISLAVLNLLPFPPFDGGHVAWMVLAKVRKSRIGRTVMEAVTVAAVAWVTVVVVTLIVLDFVDPVRF